MSNSLAIIYFSKQCGGFGLSSKNVTEWWASVSVFMDQSVLNGGHQSVLCLKASVSTDWLAQSVLTSGHSQYCVFLRM